MPQLGSLYDTDHLPKAIIASFHILSNSSIIYHLTIRPYIVLQHRKIIQKQDNTHEDSAISRSVTWYIVISV
jgi:hypothetical protein